MQLFLNCHFYSHFRVDRNKYQIHIPLPPKIDPTVTMMQVIMSCCYQSERFTWQVNSRKDSKLQDFTICSSLQVEEKPDVTYSDVGGCKEQIEKLREVVETPLLHVRDFICFSSCTSIHYTWFYSLQLARYRQHSKNITFLSTTACRKMFCQQNLI